MTTTLREESEHKQTNRYKKNGAKTKPCLENGIWREENVKRRRSQEKEMPTYKNAKKKIHQWKAAEKPSVSRDSDDIRKICLSSRASQLSTRRAVKIQR